MRVLMLATVIRNNKRIPIVLFAAIIVMLIPFIISYSFLGTTLITPLLAGAYAIQILLILFTFSKGRNKISIIFIAIGWIIFQLVTIVINLLLGIEINNYDFINILAKALNFFLFFGLMIDVRVGKIQILYFMKYLLFFSIFACVYNILFNWENIMQFWYITSAYELELKSFFVNRNQFGSFLFISIIAHYYLISSEKISKLNIIIFILQIISIILTLSRGAILATTVFFIILYFQHLRSLRVVISMVILCSILAVFIASNNEIMNFITSYIIRSDVGTAGRVEVWQMGLNIATHNNIVNGVGFYTGLDLAKAQGFQFDQFHSLFVDTLVSGGIIELMFIMILLIYILTRCLKKCSNLGYKRVYIASMFAMLTLGIFESVSFFSIGYVDTLFTIFYITIPLLLSNIKIDNSTFGATKLRL